MLARIGVKNCLDLVVIPLGVNVAPGVLPFKFRVKNLRAVPDHTMWVADSAYQADYLVYVGETPADLLKKYCDLTGYAPHFPEWAAGFWQSRLRYESQDEVLDIAREYKRRGVPLAAIVFQKKP